MFGDQGIYDSRILDGHLPDQAGVSFGWKNHHVGTKSYRVSADFLILGGKTNSEGVIDLLGGGEVRDHFKEPRWSIGGASAPLAPWIRLWIKGYFW